MDTLDKTEWDVLIVGTGLQQSLLALALSRSGKKILHIDGNAFYGGAEAAFSLQEAEEWAQRLSSDTTAGAFSDVSITRPAPAESGPTTPSLSHSRAYSLELSPQLIYARSSLLEYLVSSKVYRQLEFLAVGSWWVYSAGSNSSVEEGSSSTGLHGRLLKVPNGREDVFQDQALDFKAKRALMKFLRFIAQYEEQTEVWQEHRSQPFPAFLTEQFKVPATLQAPLLALTLSSVSASQTTTEYALPRIARHLRSIGVFGAGFGAVIPKWGGMSEIAQVACRACAVGGGVYVLGKGLQEVYADAQQDGRLRLEDGEALTAKWIVSESSQSPKQEAACCKSTTIVASPLTPLFAPTAEEAPPPASVVVVFPSGSLSLGVKPELDVEIPPVYVFVHSSDTGECPNGQSILYASTSLSDEVGFQLLKKAVDALLSTVDVTPTPTVMWCMQYQQHTNSSTGSAKTPSTGHVLKMSPPSLHLAFEDATLDRVRELWEKIMGDEADEFLVFEDRDANVDDDE